MWIFMAILGVFFILYFIIPQKQTWISFVFLVVALAVLAYRAEPNPTDDLGRYFKIIDTMRAGGWDRFQQMLDNNEFDFGALPVCGYYFYFISRLPNNYFLPFFTILISYGCNMLLIYKAAKRFKVDKFYLMIALLLMLSTYWFYDIYSGVRNGLAFAVSLICVYYHFVERKNILLCFFGYFLAIGLHSSGIVPVALAVVAWLTYNIASKVINVLLIFAIGGSSAILSFLANVTDNRFIQALAGKTEYVSGAFGFSFTPEYIANVATYLVGIVIIAYCYTYIKKYLTDTGQRRFFRFIEVVMFFMAGSIFSVLLFLRLARWILPVLIAVVYMVGMQIQKNRVDSGQINTYYLSDTPKPERIRASNKGVTSFFVFAYSVVHLWYDVAGSSLTWLHF